MRQWGLEHYFLTQIDTTDVRSREPHLEFSWVLLQELVDFDLRPHVVLDAILSGDYLQARHFVTPEPSAA
jgi:hypothetical protein